MRSASTLARSEPVAGNLHGWLLVATCWLASAGAVLIAPVLPFMQRDYAHEPHAVLLTMIVLVVPGLMIALFSPLVGSLVDLFGRKRLYMVAVTIYAIAGALPFWLTDLHAIIASRIVVGLAEATINTIAAALTANYFSGAERQKWLTMQHGSAAVVAVVMFTIGGALGSLPSGWHTPFLVYGCAIVFLPLIAIFIWEPESDTHTEHVAAVQPRLPFPWREIGHLCAMTLFSAIMFFVIPVQISFVLNARGVATPAVIGFGSAIANIGIPVGAFVFHRLGRWPINRLLVLAYACFTVGFSLIASVTDLNVTILGALIACMGGGIALPLLETWVMARVPFAQSGRGAGGYMASFFLGNFLSPLIVAAVGGVAGGLIPAIGRFGMVCGGVAVIALVLVLAKRGPRESVQAVHAGAQ
ncbi:MFS transporter [Pararobbsia silviterrae]|nr:MFS transporter [Pararobbsia silviterrae]